MVSHQLQVSKIDRLTPQSVAITFNIPENLKSNFKFKAGQFITLDIIVKGEQVRRSYSISSSENESSFITIGVKELDGGLVSTYLNRELSEGDILNVFEPEGNFTIENYQTPFLFVSAGSGITPIMSMIDSVLNHPQTKATLYYSTKNEETTMYLEKIESWQKQYPQLTVHFNYTQKGESRFNEDKLADILKQTSAPFQFYICGPNDIIVSAERAFQNLNLSKDIFHKEHFKERSDSEKEAATVGSIQAENLQPKEKASVQIKYDGKTHNFECKYEETILDAALNAGNDPPYSCMVAACSTCRAMVKEGTIEMKDRDSLSDKELAKGYVLTCQAMPRSKKISLDYDV